MDFFLGILFGSRLLAGLTGGLSPAVPAHFDPPQIVLTSRDVRVSCELRDVCPPELRRLVETSTPATLYLFVEIRRERRDALVAKTVVERRLSYDMLNRRFSVVGSDAVDTVHYDVADSAMAALGRFREIPVCPLDSLDARQRHYFVVYAVLGKATVEALGNRAVDLMYYWDYKRPSLRTESYEGRQLLVKQAR